MEEETPYSHDELLMQSGDQSPKRGLLCPKCGTRIPQFLDLVDHDRFRIRQLILNGQTTLATAELRAATDCPLSWAKLWVSHNGRPEWEVGATTPCPYCGKPLRTPVAKQCRHCGMDWHDPSK